MQFILFLIGILLSADGLYFAATTSMGIGEAGVIIAGICFILWSVFYDAAKKKGALRVFKRLFAFVMSVYFIYSCGICIFGHMDNADYYEQYIIVLGAGLHGETPSLSLQKRLDKTVEYMKRNERATAIVSGGQGEGESITEAEAMKKYLTQRGIKEDRIIKEEKATSTYENFQCSKEYMDSPNAVFVTNNFHVLRSLQMAKLNGIDAHHIGASTPLTLLPVTCMRELLAQIAVIRYF